MVEHAMGDGRDLLTDGDLDLFITGSDGVSKAQLYENTGSFYTVAFDNLPAFELASCEWADYDEDGDLDLLLAGQGSSDIYVNPGTGSAFFTALGAGLAGLSNTACDWADYDADGDLDILLCGQSGTTTSTIIYRNDAGARVPAGIYFYRFEAGSFAQTRKAVVTE